MDEYLTETTVIDYMNPDIQEKVHELTIELPRAVELEATKKILMHALAWMKNN